MCVVESWVYCSEAGLSPGCRVRCPAGFYFSLRNCCQASALKSPGDHIVEVAPGHLSSVPVFVNMGLVRQLQVEGPVGLVDRVRLCAQSGVDRSWLCFCSLTRLSSGYQASSGVKGAKQNLAACWARA